MIKIYIPILSGSWCGGGGGQVSRRVEGTPGNISSDILRLNRAPGDQLSLAVPTKEVPSPNHGPPRHLAPGTAAFLPCPRC